MIVSHLLKKAHTGLGFVARIQFKKSTIVTINILPKYKQAHIFSRSTITNGCS